MWWSEGSTGGRRQSELFVHSATTGATQACLSPCCCFKARQRCIPGSEQTALRHHPVPDQGRLQRLQLLLRGHLNVVEVRD